MEIMRPPVVRVGNRLYRKNPVLQNDRNTAEEEETDYLVDKAGYSDEICTLDQPNIEETSDGFRAKVQAPAALFKFVIGRKGETKHRLENETRTKITIPRQGQKGDIVINGHDRMGVVSAKTRIEVLLDSGRQKTPFTHFISVPFNCPDIMNRLVDFKNEVLLECDGDRGVDASIFQSPERLHLTVGCLVLLDDSDVAHATDILQQCQQELIQPIMKGDQLTLQLTGLEYMNDDPTMVDVLYAKISDQADRLQNIADRLVDRFTSAGLMQREHDRVKLHVTVMNTLFRKDPTGGEGNRPEGGRKERESFNASRILEKFGQFKFGNVTVDSIHISQRHSFAAHGYYTCVGEVRVT